jgi:hypothetical protein
MKVIRSTWPVLLLMILLAACGGDATTEVPALPETAEPGVLPPEADIVTEPPLEEAATEPVGPTPTATVIPPEGAAEAAADSSDPSSLLNLMAAGEIEVQGASMIAGAQPVGQALRVTLANPGALNVVVTLPCGLVFTPVGDGPRLMVAEPTTVTVTANGGADMIPTTMSLDADQPLPPEGTEYTVGSLAEDWLDQCAP